MKITEQKLKEIIVEHLGVESAEIKPASRFCEDLGADSLDMIELCMEVEEVIESDLSDDIVEGIKTYGDALKVLQCRGEIV